MITINGPYYALFLLLIRSQRNLEICPLGIYNVASNVASSQFGELDTMLYTLLPFNGDGLHIHARTSNMVYLDLEDLLGR